MSTSSSSSRNPTLVIVLAVLGGLVLCVCVLAALGVGGYFYFQRGANLVAEPAVEYVLDASPRMSLAIEGGTRLEVARAVLAEVVRPADATVTAGLRDFGSGVETTPCQDTNLLVPLALANQSQIADTAFSLQVGNSSDSALAEAMLAAIKDLAAVNGPHTLVVITGGADSCNVEAGELIKQEAERAGIKLQEFVIGLAVAVDEAQAIKGLIDASAGTYLDAPDADTLRNILLAIQAHIDQPSATSLATIQTAATPGAILTFATPLTTGDAATAQPGASAEPAATSEFAATATAPTGFVGQTACDYPYLPLRPGATWTYSTTAGPQVWTVESVTGDTQNAVAVMAFTVDGVGLTYSWYCSTEGLRIFRSVGITGVPEVSQEITITDESGVSLPNPDQLVIGATWNYGYTMTVTMQAEGESFTFVSVISAADTVGDIQTLETAFGSLEVITVTGANTVTVTSNFAPAQTSSSTYTQQFGKGVGMLKSEDMELVSYSVP